MSHIDDEEWQRQQYDEDHGIHGENEEDFDDVEEGEVNLFGNMPWINENIGSIMDAQLLRFKEPNQCRQCGKVDEALREKKVEERFCSEACSKEWHSLLDTRVKQGLHDLRTRGYD